MRALYYIILFLLTISCNQRDKPNEQPPFDGTLKLVKTIKLPLDEFSSYEFFNTHLIDNRLIVLNVVNSSLDFYDLEMEKLTSRLKIQPSGPEGVPRLYSFIYHNADSIYILPQFTLNGTIILNEKGEFIDRLKVDKFDSDVGSLVNHVSSNSTPSYIFDNKLHFSTFPLKTNYFPDKYVFDYTLDLKTGKFTENKEITKPEIYKNNTQYASQTFARKKLNAEQWIYSWHMSDSIFIFERDSGEIVKKSIVANGGLKTSATPINEKTTNEESLVLRAKSYIYGETVVQGDYIHRIRFFPLPEPEEILFSDKIITLIQDFEILTYNLNNAEFVGSTKFKGGIYDPRVIIANKYGIYLPKINPDNPNLSENSIEYDIFSIE
ncbi:DUF4221 family protein [Belliella marina]|uniref:DUF4221 family protein n=1 Tax=Belliella marina TaxID=1644146 RepID=A0ABW4VIM2_9BACT